MLGPFLTQVLQTAGKEGAREMVFRALKTMYQFAKEELTPAKEHEIAQTAQAIADTAHAAPIVVLPPALAAPQRVTTLPPVSVEAAKVSGVKKAVRKKPVAKKSVPKKPVAKKTSSKKVVSKPAQKKVAGKRTSAKKVAEGSAKQKPAKKAVVHRKARKSTAPKSDKPAVSQVT